jgi:hypothetical protein
LLIQGACRRPALAGEFDTAFYAVQGVELAAGATNIAPLTLNLLDSLTLKGRLRHRPV